MELVNNLHTYIHIHFAKDFLKEFLEYAMEYLKEFSLSEDRRYFKRDKIDKIIKNVQEIMFKIYFETDVNSKLDNFGIEFGSNCIKSPILDKQIFGLKIITDTLAEAHKVNSSSTTVIEKHIPLSVLLEKIHSLNILSFILNAHNEIIKNSSELIRVLLANKALSSEDVERIWTMAQSGDIDKRGIIYKILNTNSSTFSPEVAQHLLVKIMNLPLDKINSYDLEVR